MVDVYLILTTSNTLSPSCLRWFLALLPSLLWSLRCKAELQLWSAAAPLTCSTAPAHCSTAALPWNVAAACS